MVRFPPGNLTARRRPFRLLLLPALAVLAACGGGSEAVDPPSATLAPVSGSTTTTEPSEPDDPELTVEEEVEAAYLEAEKRFLVFMEDPRGSDSFLTETRTGEALLFATESASRRRESGNVTEYPSGYTTSIVRDVAVEGNSATLIACMQDDAVVVSPDGEVVDDRVSTVLFDVEMTRTSDSWMVSNQVAANVQDGLVPCENM